MFQRHVGIFLKYLCDTVRICFGLFHAGEEISSNRQNEDIGREHFQCG